MRAYQLYLRRTDGVCNKISIQVEAYTLLIKQMEEREHSSYLKGLNIAWSKVNSPLTKGLSDAKPDITESWRLITPKKYAMYLLDSLAPQLLSTKLRCQLTPLN